MLCAQCGTWIPDSQDIAVCAYHVYVDSDWSRENRIWCDYIHRGIPIERLDEEKELGKEVAEANPGPREILESERTPSGAEYFDVF